MTQRKRPAARRSVKKQGWLAGQLSRRPLPLWVLIVADALALAITLNVYALFHHVLPANEKSVGIISRRDAVTTSAQVAEPEPVEEGEQAETAEVAEAAQDQEPDPVGVFAHRFPDKFTNGEVISDSTGYRSANLNISFEVHNEPELVYYVADIYIRDIECFQTRFARGEFGRGRYQWVTDMSAKLNGVVAVNGDYYGSRDDGVVIRNGQLYRNVYCTRDICILFWDGSMRIYKTNEWNAEAVMAEGAYQGWNFGPSLLTETGGMRGEFESEVAGKNPRTAIGYYEPGHYCLVVVDGRSKASKGATLERMSVIMYNLKCKMAYNLDGGQTSCMVVGTTVVSHPASGGRRSSDAIVIVEK